MNHLKLFESFSEIDAICKKYDIHNYTINSEGLVDVDGSVYLANEELTKLPLKFGHVTGLFNCRENQLTSLTGAPKLVGGNFHCSVNQLTSLVGGPQEVGGNFYCQFNQIISLDGLPQVVGDGFYCDHNPIDAIYQLFKSYSDFLSSMDYNYLRGTNIIKSRFEEMCQEYGIKVPERIENPRYNYI